jgi:hypothetical protein
MDPLILLKGLLELLSLERPTALCVFLSRASVGVTGDRKNACYAEDTGHTGRLNGVGQEKRAVLCGSNVSYGLRGVLIDQTILNAVAVRDVGVNSTAKNEFPWVH